uniref:Major facilitator superfamily (MFS) profile domain-containing protein n=1 Tax=Ditylenchus dipsaci TaxID=166011 RepID=A0A915DPY2_9BILA
MGYASLFIIRILQGTGLPAILTMVSSVSKEWSPTITMGSYILLLSTPYQIGPIITMPIAGELCESQWGWPSVYYLQGTITLVLITLFYLFFRDAPDSPHP